MVDNLVLDESLKGLGCHGSLQGRLTELGERRLNCVRGSSGINFEASGDAR